MPPLKLTALPFDLHPQCPEGARWDSDGSTLELHAAPHSDLFTDPLGRVTPATEVLRLTGAVTGPFQLSARVSVDFRDTFDAGVLLVYADADHWLKLCFEFSPAGRGTVVSVVTRGVSDDANSWDVDGDSVFLRVSRIGGAFALHSSADGRTWQLVRVCDLGVPGEQPVEVGFLGQAPTGEGCRAVFSDIAFSPTSLEDIRDGS